MGVGVNGYKSDTGSAMEQVGDWLRPSRWTELSPFGWGYWGAEHCWKSAVESDSAYTGGASSGNNKDSGKLESREPEGAEEEDAKET